MIGFTSIHFEWVYSPENFFQSDVSISFDGGTITISNGIVTAKIDPATLQMDQSSVDETESPTDDSAEKLDEQIDELAEQIDDKIERIFHAEQKKSQKSYQLSLPFKVLVRNDGSELVAPA